MEGVMESDSLRFLIEILRLGVMQIPSRWDG
jgi:hypothetical protein